MSLKQAVKSIAIVAVILVAAVVATLAWLRFAPREVPSGQPRLTTLSEGSLAAFREAFNASEGQVRILAMLSPT